MGTLLFLCEPFLHMRFGSSHGVFWDGTLFTLVNTYQTIRRHISNDSNLRHSTNPPTLRRAACLTSQHITFALSWGFTSHSALRTKMLNSTTLSLLLHKKLTIAQLFKQFATFCGTWGFITVFTRACHWSLSWARWILFTHHHPVSLRSLL
jgi:hypothetical protein